MDTRGSRAQAADEKAARALQKNEQLGRAKLSQLENTHAANVARLQQEAEAQTRQLTGVHNAKMAKLNDEQQTRWQTLAGEWKNCIQPIHETIRAANAAADELFPGLAERRSGNNGRSPRGIQKRGEIRARWKWTPENWPRRCRRTNAWPCPFPANFSVPLALTYPAEGSILFETAKTGGDEAMAAINNIIFRLLSTTPPGKLSFTIFDPVGLGQNFAALMHLADYEEQPSSTAASGRRPRQFEEKLADLNEHMEKVIQMYLRNEYATIAEYNAQAGVHRGEISFPRHRRFPGELQRNRRRAGCSTSPPAARAAAFTRSSTGTSGSRCRRISFPTNSGKTASASSATENGFVLADWRDPGTRLMLDAAAAAGIRHAISPRGRREQQGFQPRRGAVRAGRAAGRRDLDGGHDRRTARAHRPHRRDQAAVSRHRQGHAPARA